MKNQNFTREQETKSTRTPLELLYQVSRELATTTLDLSTVLQHVLSFSLETVGASSGSMLILDDKGKPVDSAIIYKEKVIQHTTQQLQATLEQGLAGWVVRNRKAVLVSDTSTDERWLRRPDDVKTATGPKSVVAVPILAREKLVGVATLSHPQPNILKEEHLDLFQAIADQAGVAVLNARLYTESQRQARVMTALAQSAEAITSSIQLSRVLNSILKQIQDVLQVEVVTLALVDNERNDLEYKAVICRDSSTKTDFLGKRTPLGKGIIGWVVKHGMGTIVPDVTKDARFEPQLNIHPQFTPKAIACAPIRLRGDVIGVLEAINPQDGSFGSDALMVLAGIGSLAGSSIQNAQLFEELQVAHNRYHDLFENDINSIIITDLEGNLLEINRQTIQMSEFSPKALLEMRIGELHEVNWEVVGENFEALEKKGGLSYESVMKTETGNTFPIHVNVHPVQISGEKRLQWLFQDITERKELDQLRNDLTSMIYHDLRSPLSNVISSLDVLKVMLSLEGKSELQSLFNIATRSTERIQRLTKSLLDIDRLEAGQPITAQNPIPPLDIAQKAYETLIPVALNKEQDVSLTVSGKLPSVYVDDDMVERVLINLFQNAIKFTPPKGKIEIGAQQEKKNVRFWVQDTGRGIDPKAKHILFDKFTRLHPQDGPKGIGLGLAFCRLAVEGHGGHIWADNNPEGGAIFSLTLPIATPEQCENQYNPRR